ncbi:hypothetical protein ACO0LF_08360 [Undibacterium sp. Di27W]|uniref:hypothetical protein n=1 Tax=Undibacterium sp. Di27W TaxID=3413036 RepID=UPI003BF1F412
MAFIYERILEHDIASYGLREIDQQFPMAVASRWAIDRERHIYLRYMTYEREQPSHKNFSFFWKDSLFRLSLASERQSLDGEQWCASWTWLGMRDPGPDASHVFDIHHDLILDDLKDALRAYRDGSLNPAYAGHVAHFDF